MKRILSFILVAVLCLGVLTSCDTIKGWFGGEETPAATLDDAASYLHNIMKDKNETTVADFNVVAQVVINQVAFPVTWSVDNEAISIRESTKTGFYTVDLPDKNDAEFTYTLTATIKDANGDTTQKAYTFKLPVYDNTAVVGDLEEGKAYNLGIYQASLQENYYIIGQMSGYYMATTNDVNDAVNVYVEVVDGGYNMYCIYWGEKLYINMVISDTGYVNPSFDKEASTVYTYNSELKTLVGNYLNADYAFGVRTDAKDDGSYYTTFGPVLLSKADSTYFVTFTESTIADQPDHGLRTPEAIINAAYALEEGGFLPGIHTLTGTIKSIDDAYSSQYKNVTVTIEIEGFETKPIKCYRLKGTSADQIGVGDEITVTGTIKNHYGTVEFDSGCTFTNWVDNEEGGEDVGGGDNTPSTSDSYKVVTELKAGDHVLIGAPAYGKLLSMVKIADYYNVGVDYTTSNFANVTNDEIFVVGIDADGNYTFTSLSGKVLALADSYSSLNDTGVNTAWTLEAKENADGIFYLKNAVRGNYLEWYDSKNNWSTHNGTLSDLFELSFYVKSEGGEEVGGGDVGGDEGGETPAGPTEMTIPEVLASAEGTAVIVKGTVSEIYQAWNDQHSNISFYIVDDAGNRLLIFRTGTKVNIGDQVTVTGTATLYSSVIQIAQGGTTVIDVAHVCSDFTGADCLNAAKCLVCGAVNGQPLGHTTENGTCERCGTVIDPNVTETTVSISIVDYAAANNWADSKQYANIEKDEVKVAASGTPVGTWGLNTGKYYTNGNNWRIYQNENPSVTISVAEGKTIVSVKITYAVKNTGTLTLDGATIASGTVVEVNANTVTFSVGNTGTATNGQAQITAIEVIYK